MRSTLRSLLVLAFAAGCGNATGNDTSSDLDNDNDGPDDSAEIDAALPDAAGGPDAPALFTCSGGGASDVIVDPGLEAETVAYPFAWWNRGREGGKSCYEVALVLATVDPVALIGDEAPDLVEVWFGAEPVLGSNKVMVRAQAHTLELPGTFTVTTFNGDVLAGDLDAAGIVASVIGTASGNLCEQIIDPCL